MQIEVKDIYIRPGYTSMRKGINGLVDTVLGGMDMDPLGGGPVRILRQEPPQPEDALLVR